MKTGLPPIVDKNSRILILGSLPGMVSIERQQYYANPGNQFWKIIFGLYEQPVPNYYEEKVSFLRSKGIAIWDVLHQAEREGSLDAKIKEGALNDFNSFFKQYPYIKSVYFAGQKAYNESYLMQRSHRDKAYYLLPSTSAANTHKNLDGKIEEWRCILNDLEPGYPKRRKSNKNIKNNTDQSLLFKPVKIIPKETTYPETTGCGFSGCLKFLIGFLVVLFFIYHFMRLNIL